MTTNGEVLQHNVVLNGEVVSYDPKKSFGFLQELGEHRPQQFFHVSSVEGRIRLQVGDIVTFSIAPSDLKPGKTRAINVRLRKRDEVPGASATATTEAQ